MRIFAFSIHVYTFPVLRFIFLFLPFPYCVLYSTYYIYTREELKWFISYILFTTRGNVANVANCNYEKNIYFKYTIKMIEEKDV